MMSKYFFDHFADLFSDPSCSISQQRGSMLYLVLGEDCAISLLDLVVSNLPVSHKILQYKFQNLVADYLLV